jgi:hypothetical protein
MASQRMRCGKYGGKQINTRPAWHTAQGFRIKIHKDMIDDGEPTVFARVAAMTELDQSNFFHWVQKIIEPFGGDTQEAGHAHADIDRVDPVEIDEMTVNDNRRLREV